MTERAGRGEGETKLVEALRQILALLPAEYVFPADWDAQIRACAECSRWKGHSIQGGICDEHRKPLYERERWEAAEERALIHRAQKIALEAIRKAEEVFHG